MECQHANKRFVTEIITAWGITWLYECLDCGTLIEETEEIEK